MTYMGQSFACTGTFYWLQTKVKSRLTMNAYLIRLTLRMCCYIVPTCVTTQIHTRLICRFCLGRTIDPQCERKLYSLSLWVIAKVNQSFQEKRTKRTKPNCNKESLHHEQVKSILDSLPLDEKVSVGK